MFQIDYQKLTIKASLSSKTKTKILLTFLSSKIFHEFEISSET